MSNKAIVFGAAGLLGPIWANALSKKADTVYLVGLNLYSDKSIEKLVTSDPEKFKVIEQDLNLTPKSEICQDIKHLKFRYAIFSAGLDSVPNSSLDRQELFNYSWESWSRFIVDNVRIFVNSLDFFCSHRTDSSYGVAIGSMYTTKTPNPNNYKEENNTSTFLKHPGYSASKNAIGAIMRQYATHYASQGLVLNMLSPGVVNNKQPEWFRENIISKIPKDKFLDPIELEGALEFLTSPGANHLIGHELNVNGGYGLW